MTRGSRLFAAGIGLLAVLWFLLLSGWLGAVPGSVVTQRQNVLFDSDTNLWMDRMVGNAKSSEQVVHPLELILWRPPVRALHHLLAMFLPSDYAGVLAARLFVALIHGIGVGFLAFLALHSGIKNVECALLFIMYLLFTSNATAALPEHFGISNGLLSIAFVVPCLMPGTVIAIATLAIMVVLAGGTTITNVVFPAASLLHFSIKSVRAKVALLGAAVVAGLGVSLFLYAKSYTIHWFVIRYLNLRLLRDPLKAGVYAFYTVVCPAIGPTPLVLRLPGWDMVSYEPAHLPVKLSYYLGIQLIGVAAWLALLVRCVVKGLRDDRTRFFVWLPLGWILFSIVFHNIWGSEYFLYAPHWSWALMGLVVLGARHLSRNFVVATVVTIAACQLYTLHTIKNALLTISR